MTVVAASDLVFASGPLFAILSYRANSSAVHLLTLWDAIGPSLRMVRTLSCGEERDLQLVGFARERSGDFEPGSERRMARSERTHTIVDHSSLGCELACGKALSV